MPPRPSAASLSTAPLSTEPLRPATPNATRHAAETLFAPPETLLAPPETLLAPLAAAQDALARLDAQAELISPTLQAGLTARLAYAEAAGLLAARGGFAHPLDLALRDAERLGRHDVWTRGQGGGQRGAHASGSRSAAATDGALTVWLDADEKITAALHLARLLRHLPLSENPLATPDAAQARLGPLQPAATPFNANRFAAWHTTHGPDPRRRAAKSPMLLRAADAAAAWMESGIADRPDAAQALAVAALLLRRAGTLRTIPLPVWAGWTALCAPQDPGALPRLRGDVAARLAPDGASWPEVFLHMTTEAARAGSRTLTRLRQAEANGTALAARQDRRSRLPDALALLLRHPTLTAPSLARHLAITPQAALRILGQFVATGVAAEITGRKSFQAFAAVSA